MYLHSTYESTTKIIHEVTFYNLKFTNDEIAEADRMEVWCTSFKDAGPDYTQFKLLKKDGGFIAQQNVEGY